MLYYIKIILITSLVISLMGFLFATIREKYYLKNNIIIIDNNSLTEDVFEDIDINQMFFKGLKIKTGDELKIKTKDRTYKGILLGGKFKEGVIKILINSEELIELEVKNIIEVKLLREYGKFFTL